MTAPCNSESKKKDEAMRFEKSKKKATKKYADQNGNVFERIMSRGEESASDTQEYYKNRAGKAINNFNNAWEQASGSKN
ncbi:uncharacterized protein PG998_014955 [Apiospora kogelbergensis]|uniref:Uncharacterized protein n=1 Tax=Apiospora kogelbergensis TaxID=1337665 RepID=A0AAW0QMC9_9PEZI